MLLEVVLDREERIFVYANKKLGQLYFSQIKRNKHSNKQKNQAKSEDQNNTHHDFRQMFFNPSVSVSKSVSDELLLHVEQDLILCQNNADIGHNEMAAT